LILVRFKASVSMNLEVDSGPFPMEENNNLIASIIAGQQENLNEQIRVKNIYHLMVVFSLISISRNYEMKMVVFENF
jgi:hypothetical protein